MIFRFPNKKGLFLFILLTFSINFCGFSQVSGRQEPSFFDNVRFGGSLGLSFSNGFFNGIIAPKAVYDFNAYTSAGVGLLGSFSSGRRYDAYTYGGSVIGLLRPIQQLQLSAEFEQLHVDRKVKVGVVNYDESYWYPALFLGAGYNTGPLTMGLRYDVLYDEGKSIYGSALMPYVSFYF